MFKYLLAFFIIIGALVAHADIQPVIDYSFSKDEPGFRKGRRTNALIIWHNGEIVHEQYARGFHSKKKHALWSISKSITSLLFAHAEYMGKINRTDSICKESKEIPKQHCDIRFIDLIQWTSGLQWVEEYENSDEVRDASILAMLFGEGYPDMTQFVLSHPKVAKPSKSWRYSSGDSHLLASLTVNIFNTSTRNAFGSFFKKIGINENWEVESDAKEKPIGASNIYLSPKDLINVGLLVLNNGSFDGKRLIPEDWRQLILTVPEAFRINRLDHEGRHSIGGGSFWLNQNSGTGMQKPWPAAPDDTIVAQGHWGQYLVIIPSLNIVAARLGDTRDKSFRLDAFLEELVKANKND